MPKKIKLKSGNILEYINGKWYNGGKPVNIKTFTLKDTDGYYKTLMSDGTLAVKDVDENGKPIKQTYIGGNTKEARENYWKQAPIVRHAVDSIANEYNINPQILKNRLNQEGFVDYNIKNNNNIYLQNHGTDRFDSNYGILHDFDDNRGFTEFGLDDVGTLIKEGKVKPINETYYEASNINEKGREVNSVNGDNQLDNIGLTAATLKYLRDQAAKDFPNSSRQFLDEVAGIYYNRGITGGKRYIKNKYGNK